MNTKNLDYLNTLYLAPGLNSDNSAVKCHAKGTDMKTIDQ